MIEDLPHSLEYECSRTTAEEPCESSSRRPVATYATKGRTAPDATSTIEAASSPERIKRYIGMHERKVA
jgi:hypothetical protein